MDSSQTNSSQTNSSQTNSSQSNSTPFYKKWWFWLLFILFVVVVVLIILGVGGHLTPGSSQSSSQSDKQAPGVPKTNEAPASVKTNDAPASVKTNDAPASVKATEAPVVPNATQAPTTTREPNTTVGVGNPTPAPTTTAINSPPTLPPTTLPPTTTPAPAPYVTNGLIAYFNPNLTSSYPGSGSKLTSLIGNVQADIKGSFSFSNGTIRLNNTNNDINANSACVQIPTLSNIRTVSMWIYIHNGRSNLWRYLMDSRTGAGNGWVANLEVGSDWNGGLLLYNTGSQNLSVTTMTIQPILANSGRWMNLTLSSNAAFTDDLTLFGRYSYTEGLDCSFGPVLIYNRVLTPSEQLANFNAQAHAYIRSQISSNQLEFVKTISGCEGTDAAVLQSPSGQVITAARLKYGRWNNAICPHSTVSTGTATGGAFGISAGVALGTPSASKEYNLNSAIGKSTYTIDAGQFNTNSDVNDDPYSGVYKHWEITYTW
jgi:hypothetical protein